MDELQRGDLLALLDRSDDGEIACFRVGGDSFFVLRSPEHVTHVLITKRHNYTKTFRFRQLSIGMGKAPITHEGESWADQRRLIEPFLVGDHLDRLARQITAATADYREELSRRDDGERVDIASGMSALTLDIVGRSLLTAGYVRDDATLRAATIILLAGHETTASALTWMWYLLSKNPHARERLLHEIDEVLDGDLQTTYDTRRLTWTAAVFQEALRLYPPVWLIERRAIAAGELDRVLIPAGGVLLIPTYLTHRDPRIWPNPEQFDPNRFVPPQARLPRGAYLPFGAGARVCVGWKSATLQATLITALISRHFIFDLSPHGRIVPEPATTLRPRGGLTMTLHHRRTSTPSINQIG